MEVCVISLGGIIQKLTAPCRNGSYEDVVLGFDAPDRYAEGHPYFGALIGRYGNRIRSGRFLLDEAEYVLATNDGENHLHGGLHGFDKVEWDVEHLAGEPDAALRLSCVSADGEEGYPGRLNVTVTYSLTSRDELRIDYRATTDKPTPVNLTSHVYFNLAGQGRGTVIDHEVEIFASHFTPVREGLIPTGSIQSVDGTPMDFRTRTAIGERIDDTDEQLLLAGGYDHNWVLDKEPGNLEIAARVLEPSSGRQLEVYTTEPGLQFYTGNSLDGSICGKQDKSYVSRSGFCLETQHYPDSPNQPAFPPTILMPGEVYETKTVYRFTAT